MTLPFWAEKLFLRMADGIYGMRSQPFPGQARLRCSRIVSHRGEHDNLRVFENTIAAFDRAQEAGVWGVELDIQWTRDLVPVVCHDEDLSRLFHRPLRIDALSLSRLKEDFPRIPTLEEVVSRYGRRLHLMIELKNVSIGNREAQNRRLGDILSPLSPGEDYHFLSLIPEFFDRIGFAPPATFLPIAQTNIQRVSRLAAEKGYGGINAHFAVLTRRRIERHRALGQKLGTGFIRNRSTLYREVNRGVDWIFTNNAAGLQAFCRREK